MYAGTSSAPDPTVTTMAGIQRLSWGVAWLVRTVRNNRWSLRPLDSTRESWRGTVLARIYVSVIVHSLPLRSCIMPLYHS